MWDAQSEAQDVRRCWMTAMARGDFEAAWRQTDRLELPRRERHHQPFHSESYLRWKGTPLRDQEVLIRCLHGLGDTIQFARYLPLVRRIAASMVTLVQPALLPLFNTTPSLGPVVDGWTDAPPPLHTVELEIMELPYIFRSSAATLPREMPYFDTRRISSLSPLRNHEFTPGVFHIGIVWQSSNWDPRRSIPLSFLEPLQNLTGVEFHSLQQDSARDESSLFKFQPLSRQTSRIIDAAAAMLELDLIISVDTLSAHLAGALGCPVWLLLQNHADWRWQATGPASPWYPSMQIFRQPTPDDWNSVGEAVTGQLQRTVADFHQRRSVACENSSLPSSSCSA